MNSDQVFTTLASRAPTEMKIYSHLINAVSIGCVWCKTNIAHQRVYFLLSVLMIHSQSIHNQINRFYGADLSRN